MIIRRAGKTGFVRFVATIPETRSGNWLVHKLGNCGRVQEAWNLFLEIRSRNAYSWNLIIGAFATNEHLLEARGLFKKTPCTNVVTWNLMIVSCNRRGDLDGARELFERMPEGCSMTWNSMIAGNAQFGQLQEAWSFLEKMPQHTVVTWTCIMDAYAKNSSVPEAQALFLDMPERNIVSWNALLQAFAQAGLVEDARLVFAKIPQINVITCTAMITAFAQSNEGDDRLRNLRAAKLVFESVPQPDLICCNAMLSVYGHCGDVNSSRVMFNKIPGRDLITWNNLLQSFGENGELEAAKAVFRKMPQRGEITFATLLAAYTRKEEHLEEAKMFFDLIPTRTVFSWTAMIQAHAQCAQIVSAKLMFDRSPQHDEVSWSAMISACSLNGLAREALHLFRLMDLQGMRAHAVTYISAIDACSIIAGESEARLVHECVVDAGFERELNVGNALVNMFGKCGQMDAAKRVFDTMERRSVYSWTGLITAYAHNGLGAIGLELFHRMKLEDVQPDVVTLTCLLNVCSHTGLADEALEQFVVLVWDYGVEASSDHFVSLVDVLGRAGRVEQAEELLRSMPYEPCSVAWMTLLGACDKARSSEEVEFKAVYEAGLLDPENSAAYVLACKLLSKTRHIV